MNDNEAMTRISRAIKAFELTIDEDSIIHSGCYCQRRCPNLIKGEYYEI